MNSAKPDKKRKRTFNIRLIRRELSYSVQDIAEFLGVHPNTVRTWLRIGLPKIDQARPFMIHGSALIDFLTSRQQDRKSRCLPNQFYCLSCRRPRTALENRVHVAIQNQKLLMLSGSCEACGKRVRRAGSVAKLRDYRKRFRIQQTGNERLAELSSPPHNCHLDAAE